MYTLVCNNSLHCAGIVTHALVIEKEPSGFGNHAEVDMIAFAEPLSAQIVLRHMRVANEKSMTGMHWGWGGAIYALIFESGGLFKAIPFILGTNRDHLVLKFKRPLGNPSVWRMNSLAECQH